MEEKNEQKSAEVMKAIEKIMAVGSDGGVDLLAIVKKVSRNRQKGESLE